MRQDLWGFDIDFIGFDCADEIDPYDWDPKQPWSCPFKPGCGAKTLSECPAAKQRAKVLPAPERVQ